MSSSCGKVLYVAPLEFGRNPTVDAVAHGLERRLKHSDIELYVRYVEFGAEDWLSSSTKAFRDAVSAGFQAVVTWLITPTEPSEGIAYARSRGVPVVTLERPSFDVDGSVVWPNFNQGVYMSQYMSSLLAKGADIGVIGGPPSIDDLELVHGLIYGAEVCGLNVVNDPWASRYRNVSDVKSGGTEAAHAILEDFPKLMGLIPFNDETMLGTLEALEQRGDVSGIPIISRNGTPAAVDAVRQGRSTGTWDIDPITIGEMLASLVVKRVSEPEECPSECLVSPIGQMITEENLSGWVSWEERGFGRAPTAW